MKTFVSDAEDDHFKTAKFGKTVLQQMYKFYKEEQFCDFQIKVEGKVFKVKLLKFVLHKDSFLTVYKA